MKDEIKEILDDLLFTTTLPNVSIKLSKEKLNQLKDYIINLQEKNKILKNYINHLGETKLIEKNINEKEHYKKSFIYVSKEALDYKSRIKKAIEYITSEETINMFNSINAREKWLKINHKLLNILQGSDK